MLMPEGRLKNDGVQLLTIHIHHQVLQPSSFEGQLKPLGFRSTTSRYFRILLRPHFRTLLVVDFRTTQAWPTRAVLQVMAASS